MSNEVITAVISGVVSLFVSWLFFKYKGCKNKELNKKILKTNFIILIKDIQDLVSYLEKIIKERNILDEYLLQEINIHQILIDYNSIYENKDRVIRGLLEFDNIRNKIRKYFVKKIKLPDYIDRSLGINKENNWSNLGHIRFVEDSYKDLENIFIKNNLEKELKKWDKNFTFKSLQEIKEDRKQMLLIRKKELENNLKRIMDENNIDLTKKDLDDDEKKLLSEINLLESEYYSQKSAEDYYSKNEFHSLQEVHCQIYYQYKEMYDIKGEIE